MNKCIVQLYFKSCLICTFRSICIRTLTTCQSIGKNAGGLILFFRQPAEALSSAQAGD